MNFNIASGKQSCQICTQQESVRACYIDVVFSLRIQAVDCQLKLFYFLKVETMLRQPDSLLNFRKNAERAFEEAFYEKKNLDPQMHVQQENNNATVADEVDPELLAKVLVNSEMRALLNSLAKTMK